MGTFAAFADPKNRSWLSQLSVFTLAKTWGEKEAWGKNIKQHPQASRNVLEWRFMTYAMAHVKGRTIGI